MGTARPPQNSNAVSSKTMRRRNSKADLVNAGTPAKRRLLSVFGDKKTATDKIVELNNRGLSFYTNGDFQSASALFQQAASLRKQDVFTMVAGTHCADPPPSSYIYQRMDFDEGMHGFSNAEPIGIDDQPQEVAAILLFNAGQARRRMNDYDGASRYYDRALRAILPFPNDIGMAGHVHSVVIPILHNIGQLHYRLGNIQDAIETYKVAEKHSLALHGDEDITVSITLNCLGVLHYHKSADESHQALEYFNAALTIHTKILGPNHEEVATILNNMGRVHVQRDEFDQALTYYEKALIIRRERLGQDSIDYAATAFNAGQSLHQKGDHDRAIELYQEFLQVALAKFSKNHRDIAVVMSGIAQIHQERKEYDKALELYEESLAVGKAALGEHHSEVAMLLNRIGNFHFERDNLDAALQAYRSGLEIEQKVLEPGHPNMYV